MQRSASRSAKLLRGVILLAIALVLGFGGGRFAAQTLGELTGKPAHEEQAAPVSQDSAPQSEQASPSVWDQQSAPNYYLVTGPAQVIDAPAAGEVIYGDIDALGRATGVVANITFDLMEEGLARQRGDLSSLYPSGWGHNREVDIAMPDGTIYHGFLYNRSHLLAKSLGGDDELHNLVTGTRMQNVGANIEGTEGGMAYCEGLARDWLWSHRGETVVYRATPCYEGGDLVARSVMVDLLSSDGDLDCRVEVFNAARGFAINYATGEFEVTERAEDAAADIREQLSSRQAEVPQTQDGDQQAGEAAPVVPQGSPESEDGERMVIVTGSGKAYHHDETCSGLAQAKSMRWVTVSEAEEMGRHPCGICGG